MTGREWKPGEVAMVGNRYDTGDWKRGVCVQGGALPEAVWLLDTGLRVWGSVHQVRPLVVIDPEDAETVRRLADLMPWALHSEDTPRLQAALRELADPKPPKPDEPTGIGAVVVDRDGVTWVRASRRTTVNHWRCADVSGIGRKPYARIDAVEVLSEGVEPLADWERDLLRGAR